MDEVSAGTLTAISLLLTVFCAWVQMLGGRSFGELLKWNLNFFGPKSNRIYYRILFPVLFTLTVVTVSLLSDNFHLTKLLVLPYFLVITHFGHTKFYERVIECILYGLSYIFVYNIIQFYVLFIAQMALCIVAACIGHFAREKKAPTVELLVNFLRILFVGV